MMVNNIQMAPCNAIKCTRFILKYNIFSNFTSHKTYLLWNQAAKDIKKFKIGTLRL